jgi:hypothetical protein
VDECLEAREESALAELNERTNWFNHPPGRGYLLPQFRIYKKYN